MRSRRTNALSPPRTCSLTPGAGIGRPSRKPLAGGELLPERFGQAPLTGTNREPGNKRSSRPHTPYSPRRDAWPRVCGRGFVIVGRETLKDRAGSSREQADERWGKRTVSQLVSDLVPSAAQLATLGKEDNLELFRLNECVLRLIELPWRRTACVTSESMSCRHGISIVRSNSPGAIFMGSSLVANASRRSLGTDAPPDSTLNELLAALPQRIEPVRRSRAFWLRLVLVVFGKSGNPVSVHHSCPKR